MKLTKQKLSLIVDALNQPNKADQELIKATLEHCPKRLCVEFAYSCALSVKYLLTDERSLAALSAVELYLSNGTKVPKEAFAAAYDAAYAANAAAAAAAHAAYAAAYTVNAAAVYTAAVYATYAADAAEIATVAYASDKQAQQEKLREYLNMLKELVLAYTKFKDRNFLLEVII